MAMPAVRARDDVVGSEHSAYPGGTRLLAHRRVKRPGHAPALVQGLDRKLDLSDEPHRAVHLQRRRYLTPIDPPHEVAFRDRREGGLGTIPHGLLDMRASARIMNRMALGVNPS